MMKIVVAYFYGYWHVSRDMFGSYLVLGYSKTLKEALEMANRIAQVENMVIEMRVKTHQEDGSTEDTTQYLYSDTDVLRAILTHC
jgi:hypothetical protein